MTPKTPSYQDLYELVDNRTKEIMIKFDVLDSRVDKLETWRETITLKITALASIVGVVTGLTMDLIKKKVGLL